ncbi:MAG: GNAT family N-acetyltransferase [Lactobacillus sp.]|nr:GNAT family N-acetyltransferase [Lactobacillus sp.]
MKLTKNDNNLKQIKKIIFPKEANVDFENRYKNSEDYGIISDGKLSSYIMLNIFNYQLFRKRVNVAGIGYIANNNESTGEEKTTKLLKEIIEDLHVKDIAFANIATHYEEFFKQFGFENTIYQKNYQFDSSNINDLADPMGGKILVGDWHDLEIQNGAVQLYEVPMHTSNERNTMNRSYWWWNKLADQYPTFKLAVYIGRIGLPLAYMFYEEKSDQIVIPELFSNDAEGIEGLFDWLKQKNKKITLTMPIASHIEQLCKEEEKIDVYIKPIMMSRIINLDEVLACIKLENNSPIVIEITSDNLCPWNIGKWKVQQSSDKVIVEKTDEEANFSGDINSWNKVFLGNLTIKDAIKLGEIKMNRATMNDVIKGTVTFYDYY